MPQGVINYAGLEKVMVEIEGVFKAHGLDIEEKGLVIRMVNTRINKQIQKQQAQDMIGGMDGGLLGGLAKKFMKGQED